MIDFVTCILMRASDIVKKKECVYGYTASKAQLSTKSTISRAKAEVTEASFSAQANTILLQPLRSAGGLQSRASD